MYILNLEDNAGKHSDICRTLESAGIRDLKIERVRNLEEGLARIKEQSETDTPFDLVITDMWFPEVFGGADVKSGEKLIKKVADEGWNIPIILCSSMNYKYEGILGSVHYSEKEDWETALVRLVKTIN